MSKAVIPTWSAMSGSSDEAAASVEALLDFCEEVEEHEEPPAVDKNRLEHWNQ